LALRLKFDLRLEVPLVLVLAEIMINRQLISNYEASEARRLARLGPKMEFLKKYRLAALFF